MGMPAQSGPRQTVERRRKSQALSLPIPPCSMAVVRWPQSLQLKLYERTALRDTLVAQLQLPVPGHAGRPPADAAPVAYEWTSAGSFSPYWAAGGTQACSQACAGREHLDAPVVGTGRCLRDTDS